jgi:hypothetical protein
LLPFVALIPASWVVGEVGWPRPGASKASYNCRMPRRVKRALLDEPCIIAVGCPMIAAADPEAVARLRGAYSTGRPIGARDWIENLEARNYGDSALNSASLPAPMTRTKRAARGDRAPHQPQINAPSPQSTAIDLTPGKLAALDLRLGRAASDPLADLGPA